MPPSSTDEDSTHPFPRALDVDQFVARLRALAEREPFLLPREVVPSEFKRSSVLLCFWREREDLRVLLTRRAETLRGHPGQMSFPGGRLEPNEDWRTAALRETEEEVGIPTDEIEVVGRLDDAWSGAGHVVVPAVGWLSRRPVCRPNPAEVSEIHRPSVAMLIAPEAYEREAVRLDGEIHYNSTLSWPDGSVFGLSTDLLIEAIQWGLGLDARPGPDRQRSLEAYLRGLSVEAKTRRANAPR